MKRCIAIAMMGSTCAIARGVDVAPYQSTTPAVPIDIYFDYTAQAFVGGPGGDDGYVYRNDPPGIISKVGPVPPPPPPPPPPDTTPKIVVSDDVHTDTPEGMAVRVTECSVVFETFAAGSYGNILFYANDATNTQLPDHAEGDTAAFANLVIPPIPYPAGMYRLHIINIDVRMPSPHAWFGAALYHPVQMPIMAIGANPTAEIGYSLDVFAWTGYDAFLPGRYNFGPEGPKGDMLITLNGTPYCPTDFDYSGFVDLNDLVFFLTSFVDGHDDADFDGSGFVDFDDFNDFIVSFESGC